MRQLISLFLSVILFACEGEKDQQQNVNPQYELKADAFGTDGLKDFFSWTEDRIPLVSAHRGGPYEGYPENAIETFEHIMGYTPAIIECDVAITKDSVLVLMHDNTLDRTTTGSGKVTDFTLAELQALQLRDNEGNLTPYKIPTLDEVLKWGYGRALFTVDVKRGVPFEMIVEAIEANDMESYAAVITYNADAAAEVYRLNANLMISVGIGNEKAYKAHQEKGIPDQNMIAFVGVSEPTKAHYEFLHQKNISTILGVLGNLDKQAQAKGDSVYLGFVNRGADVLATDRPIEAAQTIRSAWPEKSDKYKFLQK